MKCPLDTMIQSYENQCRQFEALEVFDSRELVSTIKADTLVICGKQDVLSLPYESKELADSIPNATFHEIDCGHGMAAEEPRALTDLLIPFLKK